MQIPTIYLEDYLSGPSERVSPAVVREVKGGGTFTETADEVVYTPPAGSSLPPTVIRVVEPLLTLEERTELVKLAEQMALAEGHQHYTEALGIRTEEILKDLVTKAIAKKKEAHALVAK